MMDGRTCAALFRYVNTLLSRYNDFFYIYIYIEYSLYIYIYILLLFFNI